jgi:choline dehydrogenase-like flavoprotein
MKNGEHYDFVIIGTGAGGGTLAWKLAPSGKRILLLERGPYVPREKDNWNPRAVNVEGKYNTKEIWRDKDGKELHPHTNYYVGGNTKFYGAALFRLREADFGEIRHHGGISPAWPISYDDLEPYYAQAERLYHVHGVAGEDPSEPRRSGPYPFSGISHEPRIQQLSDDFARLGLQPFHTPLGVMLDEKKPPKSRCIRCNTCDGFPCLVNAKADAHICCVEPALEHPNVTLLTNARVTRLETDASGRAVTAVRVERDGAEEIYSCDIVVSSGGAINSAALLLRSANDKHPNGLANGSGVVGRHLRKLRAKGLVEKLPKSRRYRLRPQGYSVCLVFLKLFERVYSPLTAGLLQPYSADSKLQHHKRTQLDRLYQKIVDDLDELLHAVGLKAA